MILESENKADFFSSETGLNGLRAQILPILKAASDNCEATTALVYLHEDSEFRLLTSNGAYDEPVASAVKKLSSMLAQDDGLSIIQNCRDHKQASSRLSDVEMDKVQFYAGAIIRSETGTSIGTFCICDSSPCELSVDQKQQLRMMVDRVKDKLILFKQTKLLNESNRKLKIYSALLNNSADLTFLLEPESGEITHISNGVEKELGYSPNMLLGKPFTDIVNNEDLEGDTIDQWFSTKNQHKGRYSTTIQFIDHQNRNKSYKCDFSADKNHWYVTAKDISDKIEARQGGERLKDKLQKVVSVATDLIYELDWASGDLSWGDELTDVLGYPYTEKFVNYDWWLDKIHSEDLDRVIHNLEHTAEGEHQKSELVYRIRTYEGSYKYVINRVYVDRNEDGTPETIIGAIVDVSEAVELKAHSKTNEKSLKEKETLLAEIHHRVKNNLAVVSGMLHLQIYNETDEMVQQKLFASTNRIKTMASIHELLYKSPDFVELRINENIEEIITSLVDTFGVSVDLDVSYNMELIDLNINDAIPCSLIVNEVITNILKHAFDNGDSGSLEVYLNQEKETVTLKIRDDGKGLPDDFNFEGNGSSLGMELIQTFTKQLKGESSYASLDRGVEFTLVFEKSDRKGVGSNIK